MEVRRLYLFVRFTLPLGRRLCSRNIVCRRAAAFVFIRGFLIKPIAKNELRNTKYAEWVARFDGFFSATYVYSNQVSQVS